MKKGGANGQDSSSTSKEVEAREETVSTETQKDRDNKTSLAGGECENSSLQATAREKSRSVSDAISGEAGQPPAKGTKRRPVRQRLCRVPGCYMDVCKSNKRFNMRYRICEDHRRAGSVSIDGEDMRFCQMCARFHVLGEFDDTKMTCRSKLGDHNLRRRMGNRRKRALMEAEEHKLETEKEPAHAAGVRGGRGASANAGAEPMEAGRTDTYHDDQAIRQEVAPHGVMAGSNSTERGIFFSAESADLLTQLIQSFLRQSDTQSHRNGTQLYQPMNSSSHRSASEQALDARRRTAGVDEEYRVAERALHNAFNQPQSAQYMQWLMQQVAARQLAARQLAAQQFAAQQFAAQQLAAQQPATQQPAAQRLAAQQVAAQQATMDQEILHRVSMKIFGCEPQDLSPGILSEVERLLRVSPGEVSAYTRPGCVNITLDIWTHRHCLLPRDHNFARNFIISLLPKKLDKGFTIQYLESLVLHENSSICKTKSFPLQSSPIFDRALMGVEPACLIASSGSNVTLAGEYVGLKSSLHLCRQKSRFLKFLRQQKPESRIDGLDVPDHSENLDTALQATYMKSRHFQIQERIEPGYLEFELEVDFILSKSVPVLVVPDTQLGHSVSKEINSLQHADIFDLIRATGKLVDLLESRANGYDVDSNLLVRLAVYSLCTAHHKGLNALTEYIHNHLREFLDIQYRGINNDKDFVELNQNGSSWKTCSHLQSFV